MTLSSYNGFSAAEREASGNYRRELIRRGLWKRGCTVDEALSTPRIQDGLTKSGTTKLERWLRGGR